MHRPPTLATVAEATPPPERGVLRAQVTQARRASRDVVAHFFESGQRRRLRWGRGRERTLMAGAVALASTGYIAAIDEKAWRATSARPGRPGSHSVSRHCHGDSSRAEYARRKVESILLERGLDRSQLRPPGQAVVRRTVPLRA